MLDKHKNFVVIFCLKIGYENLKVIKYQLVTILNWKDQWLTATALIVMAG